MWDITYACPLRCTHCYSESGRRPTRQLTPAELLRVADAMLSLRPSTIVLAGGEPLVVRGLSDVVDRITAAGVEVLLYTSGWSLSPTMIDEVVARCAAVSVSLDGATAEVHDAVRGRSGSFDRAMRSLTMLNDAVRERRRAGGTPFEFGIDATIVRSSFDQVASFCEDIAPRFSELSYVALGPAMPIGLGSRAVFVEHELLDDEQVDRLTAPEQLAYLRSLAPPPVQVSVTDNRLLSYRPDLLARGRIPAMQVEPDGLVRAMAIYEGTVGSLLTDPPAELWRRSVDRWRDPFVVDTLTPVRTMREWAEATRRLDYRFGTDDDRARIDNRPVFLSLSPSR
ncbi:radical SAM protein [Actinophytocola xanthii]|uniref:radical SAM protein n=1 Tax=Actinophytocola xanthii TaxID=1912961 RepID=UPI0018E90C55|nr:radical SAM protein [Actinophytocola xanthii]